MKPIAESFTAAELADMIFEPLRFICPPIIAPGATLIAGKPKVNKTWFCQEISLSVAMGGAACGEWRCEEGDVLFFALEDNKRRLQRRLSLLRPNGEWPGALEFRTSAPRLGDGFEDEARRWAARVHTPRLIIVDTFNFIRPMRSNDRVSYQTDYADGSALTTLAEELGVAVLAVHHLRKMAAEDPLDGISGTTGIAAGFDSILCMTRTPEGLLKLDGRGRDIMPVEIALDFDAETARWSVIGDPALAAASAERRAILHCVQNRGEAGPKDIADATGLGHDSVRQLLAKLVRDGLLRKSGYGSYAPAHSVHTAHTSGSAVNGVSAVMGDAEA
jgi:DNA-binding transcriptional ArsR family regulator